MNQSPLAAFYIPTAAALRLVLYNMIWEKGRGGGKQSGLCQSIESWSTVTLTRIQINGSMHPPRRPLCINPPSPLCWGPLQTSHAALIRISMPLMGAVLRKPRPGTLRFSFQGAGSESTLMIHLAYLAAYSMCEDNCVAARQKVSGRTRYIGTCCMKRLCPFFSFWQVFQKDFSLRAQGWPPCKVLSAKLIIAFKTHTLCS